MRNKIIKAAVLLMIPFAIIAIHCDRSYAEGGGLSELRAIDRDTGQTCHLAGHTTNICDPSIATFEDNDGAHILTINSDNMEYMVNFSSDDRGDDGYNLTIKASRDVSDIMLCGSGGNMFTFDLGEGHTFNGITNTCNSVDVVIKSGTINDRVGHIYDFVIDGGVYNNSGTFAKSRNFVMNGGEVNITSQDFYPYNGQYVINKGSKLTLDARYGTTGITGKVIINGGTVEATDFRVVGDLEINGGVTNLKRLYVTQDFTINKGQLAITCDNQLCRRTLNYPSPVQVGEAFFNGGITTIYSNEESTYAILTDNGLNLGLGVKILEDGVTIEKGEVYGNDYEQEYISATSVVTIAGANDPDPSDDTDDESDIKVPDTGTINSKEGGAFAIFAMSTSVILAIIGLATHLKNRNKDHYVLDK